MKVGDRYNIVNSSSEYWQVGDIAEIVSITKKVIFFINLTRPIPDDVVKDGIDSILISSSFFNYHCKQIIYSPLNRMNLLDI